MFHHTSFGDQAMRTFDLDMKARGREDLIPSVRAQQAQLVLLKVGYVYWILFPDKHMMMTTQSEAKGFARQWVAAWNSHDLDAIMSHYDVDVVLISPVAASILDNPSGTVEGNAALRNYFKHGLELYPNLNFELLDVMCGLSSIVVCYKNQKGTRTAEFMEFGKNGKIIRVVANYSG